MFKNLTVAKRLALGFGIVVILRPLQTVLFKAVNDSVQMQQELATSLARTPSPQPPSVGR